MSAAGTRTWARDRLSLASRCRSFAMSLVSGMWGVGSVAGPALGGLLYSRGDGGALGRFPALLPNAVGSLLSAVALVAVRAVLPKGGTGTGRARRGTRTSDRATLVDDDGAKAAVEEGVGGLEDADGVQTQAHTQAHTQGRNGDAATRRRRRCGGARLGVPRSSLLPVGVYSLFSLVAIFNNEILPLWLVAPLASGGLGWTPSAVGVLISTGGACLATSNFVVYPRLAKRYPPSASLRTPPLPPPTPLPGSHPLGPRYCEPPPLLTPPTPPLPPRASPPHCKSRACTSLRAGAAPSASLHERGVPLGCPIRHPAALGAHRTVLHAHGAGGAHGARDGAEHDLLHLDLPHHQRLVRRAPAGRRQRLRHGGLVRLQGAWAHARCHPIRVVAHERPGVARARCALHFLCLRPPGTAHRCDRQLRLRATRAAAHGAGHDGTQGA